MVPSYQARTSATPDVGRSATFVEPAPTVQASAKSVRGCVSSGRTSGAGNRGCAGTFAEVGAAVVCSARTKDQSGDTAAKVRSFGRRALQEIRCRLTDRVGDVTQVPCLRFLYVDCDPDAVAKAVSAPPDVALAPDEVFPVPLQPVTQYRRRQQRIRGGGAERAAAPGVDTAIAADRQ